ncbi:Ketosteroid isomerase-like protein [Lysobacter dokdonensis DS-58]|uniref:Ketosteroid isomerase-like protein n=1 Tax=Lysobacter dokdonensis DS-58 TaxID=1300345 RepID=A0A0A2WHN1_9GAMM|nr:nuclear transport factor 2 family protein [Lysobacter dokdonensis]KGQ17770.1 Ketosteroid isomerase-like protein [Lysobacter dokdonensis DS-58]
MQRRFLTAFWLILAMACAPAFANDKAPAAGAVMHPEDMASRFNTLYAAGDIEGLVALFEPQALLRVGDSAPVHGRDAIRDALKGFIAPGAVMETTHIDVLEHDGLAFVSTRWRIHGALEMEGTSREVLRRQPDGRWLYAIDLPEPKG